MVARDQKLITYSLRTLKSEVVVSSYDHKKSCMNGAQLRLIELLRAQGRLSCILETWYTCLDIRGAYIYMSSDGIGFILKKVFANKFFSHSASFSYNSITINSGSMVDLIMIVLFS